MTNSSDFLNISECPEWSENELYIFDRFTFWTVIVSGFGVSVVGIGFNILAIIVLISMKSRNNIFNYLLIYLLCADSAFLLCGVIYIFLDHLITSDRLLNQLTPMVLGPTYYITLTLSIFFTVAISHERFVAIQHPIEHSQKMKSAKSRRNNLLKYLISIIAITILFNLPKFFELEVVWYNQSQKEEETIHPKETYLRYFPKFGQGDTTEHR